MYLLVYVDDILVTGTSTDLVQQVIDALAAKFTIKDMGHLSYFLESKLREHHKGYT